MEKIYKATGQDFRQYKDTTIKHRLETRLRLTNSKTYQEYINYLDKHQEEYNSIVSTLVINVTQFFRDKNDWQIIKEKVLPQIIAKSKEKKRGAPSINIWSIACASGEEPYSLAITLREILGKEIKKINIRIYGTDIDEASLAKAREGVYDKSKLEGVEPELIEKYFRKNSSGKYQVNAEIKEMVKFLRHSIVNGDNFAGFDFIICRNLLIYFTRQLQEKVYLKLYNALIPGGLLWLGRAETPVGKAAKLFHCLYYKERVYQR
ncbi:MAG: protein-glutamate O-methyltransferase CheR [Caldiserica bacterium]|nr:protein-glutamate O-methyltransferase CheR [Caldisericota bacterium]